MIQHTNEGREPLDDHGHLPRIAPGELTLNDLRAMLEMPCLRLLSLATRPRYDLQRLLPAINALVTAWRVQPASTSAIIKDCARWVDVATRRATVVGAFNVLVHKDVAQIQCARARHPEFIIWRALAAERDALLGIAATAREFSVEELDPAFWELLGLSGCGPIAPALSVALLAEGIIKQNQMLGLPSR